MSPPGDIVGLRGWRGKAQCWGTARRWEWMDRLWIDRQHLSPGTGMTGILMCAAGLPVCLTRAPKPILHPPPVSKSDIKPVPGVNGICRKTKKKHLKKSKDPLVALCVPLAMLEGKLRHSCCCHSWGWDSQGICLSVLG